MRGRKGRVKSGTVGEGKGKGREVKKIMKNIKKRKKTGERKGKEELVKKKN